MKETKYVCDHCGKKLDEMKDYIDVGEDIGIGSNINGDLCSDCYHELENIIIEFFQRKEFCEKEDKNKSGTLVELPCKVGDIVYEAIKGMPILEWEVESLSFNTVYPKGVLWVRRKTDHVAWKFWGEDFGNKIFTTKEAAEARLNELRVK